MLGYLARNANIAVPPAPPIHPAPPVVRLSSEPSTPQLAIASAWMATTTTISSSHALAAHTHAPPAAPPLSALHAHKTVR